VYPSQANFQLVGFPGADDAAACAAALAEDGLLVRRFSSPAFARHLRISIGPGAALERTADIVDAFVRARGMV
jgi:histidinol-phosphate aminotransferase